MIKHDFVQMHSVDVRTAWTVARESQKIEPNGRNHISWKYLTIEKKKNGYHVWHEVRKMTKTSRRGSIAYYNSVQKEETTNTGKLRPVARFLKNNIHILHAASENNTVCSSSLCQMLSERKTQISRLWFQRICIVLISEKKKKKKT